MMDTADLLLTIWALIGALAGAVIYRVFKRRGCLDTVIDGALGGAVAGTLVYKLHLGLPFYSGTLVSALVGAIAADKKTGAAGDTSAGSTQTAEAGRGGQQW